MAPGQMQTHLRHQLPDPASDLDEMEPEGIQLHPKRSTLDQLPPQGVQQPVGTSVQEQPELVGHQAWPTQALGLYVQLEVLDPILALPALDVELVEVLGPVCPRADQEARVGPLLHDLRLVDDPAFPLQACGPVATF